MQAGSKAEEGKGEKVEGEAGMGDGRVGIEEGKDGMARVEQWPMQEKIALIHKASPYLVAMCGEPQNCRLFHTYVCMALLDIYMNQAHEL